MMIQALDSRDYKQQPEIGEGWLRTGCRGVTCISSNGHLKVRTTIKIGQFWMKK
ncbi:hypothetical protein [Paenibacillus polymyxa]|uniref:hypothetical protein n=1 Tax=Paenibacillus polymyxa TaxID=1406 RepID=UPI00234A3121|nr:hypothetical protein [Paenibacillus polymyxa]WCM63758.1 hypothetical protein OYT09_12870 [Paenibacillus polymyxa]